MWLCAHFLQSLLVGVEPKTAFPARTLTPPPPPQSTMIVECSLSSEAQLHVSRIGFRALTLTDADQHEKVYFSDVDFLADVSPAPLQIFSLSLPSSCTLMLLAAFATRRPHRPHFPPSCIHPPSLAHLFFG